MSPKLALSSCGVVCALLVGCGGGDGGSEQLGGSAASAGAASAGRAGAGGSVGGSSGAGGAAAGTGGAAAGAGGAAGGAGAGGAAAGTGGAAAGTGGAAAGAGGAGAGSGGASAGTSGMAGGGAGGAAAGAGGAVAGAAGAPAGAGGAAGAAAGQGGSPATPPPTVTLGATDRTLLLGAVVTPDTAFDGEVLVVGDKISCVGPAGACGSLPEASGATVITTNGVIAPGLIDTHNHILFDVFDDDDWMPLMSYDDHNDWPKEARYAAMLDVKQCLEDASQGKPAWCPAKWDGAANSLKCELDKWGELKGMIAGTTSIVGLPGTSGPCFASLSRSVDVSQNDLGVDWVQTSALFPPSGAAGVCANFADKDTHAFLVHCGEGITGGAADGEFATLSGLGTPAGCLLSQQTAITHGTAFTQADFQVMVDRGMKLTWSPRSNWALYGKTTDIPAALSVKDAMGNGLVISLGPDWSMGGSVNMLDEMRFAAKWDDDHFGDLLTSKDILTMATVNGAKVLAYEDRLGQLKAGYLADLFVVPGSLATAYDDVLAARPKDVRAVMVGGKLLYGHPALKPAAPANPGCEDLDVCGTSRFVCVAEASSSDKLGQTHADIKGILEAAMQEVDQAAGVQWKFAPLAPLVNCAR
ncbi:MAG: amidohydrolase family protein [Polyangiaceae bacterium]|nr:amidohydrolase family protein [Polyangiaceae bacterium]